MGGRPDKNKEGRPDTSDTGPIGLVYINQCLHVYVMFTCFIVNKNTTLMGESRSLEVFFAKIRRSVLSKTPEREGDFISRTTRTIVQRCCYLQMARHYKRKSNKPPPSEEALQLAVNAVLQC